MNTTDDVRKAVEAIRWFHQIDLGNGIVTPGIDATGQKLGRLGLPADLPGKSVLDIGAWDGFFSFEAERRHARRVLATDSFIWTGKAWGSKKGFDLCKQVLNSKIEEKLIDVLELSEACVGRFDVVLFLGVLYHMKHPLLALERVFDVTGDMLILETVVDAMSVHRPMAAFYPEAELNHDVSNWWGPNLPALVGMVKAVGFSRVEVHSIESTGAPRDIEQYGGDRAVVHAWR